MPRLSNLLAAALGFALVVAVSGTSRATVYTVNDAIGAGGVTGSITTDGALGTLSGADIANWNLVLNDGTTTFALVGPGSSDTNSQVLVIGNSLSATANALLYNFAGLGFVLFQSPEIGSGVDFFCLEGNGCSGNTNSENLRINGTTQVAGEQGETVVASVAGQTQVPEPASIVLVGGALAGLGWMRRRKSA